ncbi:hypothetical protein EYF80_039146 [Liparis tanakae]|uniref:Uncharacterized protein n=1 Tax=Liparis tanakae TaxID=230148 RepID=A0A4Z2GCH8_9TELE|nr:hypothetical protein EYF80_039146 [Liparis tanakae]
MTNPFLCLGCRKVVVPGQPGVKGFADGGASGGGRADLDYSRHYRDQLRNGAWACVSNLGSETSIEDIESTGRGEESLSLE